MPTTLAQWTGIAVTSLVVLGTDTDVLIAVPLGVFAGALATFFSSIAEGYLPKTGNLKVADGGQQPAI
jgi:hypothetical protein